jgi:hypothetical protein
LSYLPIPGIIADYRFHLDIPKTKTPPLYFEKQGFFAQGMATSRLRLA